MPRPSPLAVALLLALAGCAAGPRRPLFGGPDDPPSPARAGPAADAPRGPPARGALASAPEAALLAELRGARTEAERRQAADALVARGPAARAAVAAALDEEGLLVDLLEDALRRLDAGAPALRPPGRAVDAPWAEEKHALALDRYHAGDTFGALRIIDAVLALEPDVRIRDKLLRLLRRCRDRQLRESVLVADLVPGADVLVPSQPLQARVRLTNLSREPITLKVEQGTLGAVVVTYEELAEDGRHTTSRAERRVAFDGDLVVPAGQSRELPLELGRPHERLPADVVGRVVLGGRLRAHTMLVGDVPYPYFVPLLPAEVVVVAPGDLALARDPGPAFAAAVAEARAATGDALRAAARRAFVAAVALGQRDAPGATATVAEALAVEGTRGPLCDALCAALGRLTGEPLGFTRGEWLWWWRGQRSRPERGREGGE